MGARASRRPWPRQLATTDAHAARASSSGSAKAVGTPFPAWTRDTNSWEMLEAASPSAPPRAATRAGTSCACGSHDVDMSRAMNCVIWPGSAAAGSPTQSVVTVCSTASDPMCSSSRGISFGSAKPAATAAAAVAAAAAAAALLALLARLARRRRRRLLRRRRRRPRRREVRLKRVGVGLLQRHQHLPEVAGEHGVYRRRLLQQREELRHLLARVS